MGKDLDTRSRRSRKRSDSTASSASSSSYSSDSESPGERRRSRRRSSRRSSGRKESGRRRRSGGKKEREDGRESSKKRKREIEKRARKRRHYSSSSSDSDDSEPEPTEPEALARLILERFPDVASDLEKLLQMVDNGQGIDMKGISEKSLVKLLKKLLSSLKLKHNEKGVFYLPPTALRTLEVIGPLLCSHRKSGDEEFSKPQSPNRRQASLSDIECIKGKADTEAGISTEAEGKHDSPTPGKRRLIGPEMPSRELLAAAAELTEADTLLREADLEDDNGLLIGPPPPAMVAEAESANEAERFEEVARIAAAEVDKPYDVLGVNSKMSSDNIKKRYWKLSLIVHPDKCSHPQAQQAFVKLNQAFKDLQDPTKRQAIDEKIKLKEEQEMFMAELKVLREAAQWRKLQGISIEGDEELLAVPKEAPKRDEWMTTLPPERKPGMTMQSTSFSKTGKEGRGDTSIWTDSPLDKAARAKQNYLEAYDRTKALADADDVKKTMGSDAALVDKYNASRRSKSLVQKHQEESSSQRKRKSKQPEKEEWVGKHPWKPWDREKDLTAGRQKVNLDSESMAQGLSSRFSSGAVQRNFL